MLIVPMLKNAVRKMPLVHRAITRVRRSFDPLPDWAEQSGRNPAGGKLPIPIGRPSWEKSLGGGKTRWQRHGEDPVS